METTPAPATAPPYRKFTLDFDVKQPNGEIAIPAGTEIQVRKPGSGELRGLTLMALNQLDVATLAELAPRITTPVIQKLFVLDPADLMQLGGEVMDFLLPKAAKTASPTT